MLSRRELIGNLWRPIGNANDRRWHLQALDRRQVIARHVAGADKRDAQRPVECNVTVH